MNNVISLFGKKKKPDVSEYEGLLKRMDKLELIEEMVRFQEWRARTGELTEEMIAKGIPLFKALHNAAETYELSLLTKSYIKHLEHESKELHGY